MTEEQTQNALEHLQHQLKAAGGEFEVATGLPLSCVRIFREDEELEVHVTLGAPRKTTPSRASSVGRR